MRKLAVALLVLSVFALIGFLGEVANGYARDRRGLKDVAKGFTALVEDLRGLSH